MNNIYSQKDIDKLNVAEMNKKMNETLGIYYCTFDDNNYPASLLELKDRPPLIYYKGNIELLNNNDNIAVIGSRNCSQNGLKIAYETGKKLAENKINVVNGLALGCDTAALRGAIDNGGTCVAVMPSGLDNIQPKSNRKLAEEILESKGCLISEYPIGTELKKYCYVQRDRLQSGVSQGVIIIEAGEKSGTMHTADFAINQYKRIACYYHKLLKFSSGNRLLQNMGKATVLQNDTDLNAFINNINKKEQYHQFSLFE